MSSTDKSSTGLSGGPELSQETQVVYGLLSGKMADRKIESDVSMILSAYHGEGPSGLPSLIDKVVSGCGTRMTLEQLKAASPLVLLRLFEGFAVNKAKKRAEKEAAAKTATPGRASSFAPRPQFRGPPRGGRGGGRGGHGGGRGANPGASFDQVRMYQQLGEQVGADGELEEILSQVPTDTTGAEQQ